MTIVTLVNKKQEYSENAHSAGCNGTNILKCATVELSKRPSLDNDLTGTLGMGAQFFSELKCWQVLLFFGERYGATEIHPRTPSRTHFHSTRGTVLYYIQQLKYSLSWMHNGPRPFAA